VKFEFIYGWIIRGVKKDFELFVFTFLVELIAKMVPEVYMFLPKFTLLRIFA